MFAVILSTSSSFTSGITLSEAAVVAVCGSLVGAIAFLYRAKEKTTEKMIETINEYTTINQEVIMENTAAQNSMASAIEALTKKIGG